MWYDRFANFYDLSVELVYSSYRKDAVEALDAQPGDHVLDLACGTGPNLPHLARAVGETGGVIAVDYSAGMLRRATARVERQGLAAVHTLECDAREVTREELERAMGQPLSLSGVLVTLGLSVIPDWEAVVGNVRDVLEPGGRFVVFDVHAERRVPATTYVEWIAQADVGRRAWPLFEALGDEVSWSYLRGSPHVHGGRPYLLTARKK